MPELPTDEPSVDTRFFDHRLHAAILDALRDDDSQGMDTLLARWGAGPDLPDPRSMLALLAALDSKPACLALLLSRGADPDSVWTDSKGRPYTMLHAACSRGDARCLRALLDAGAALTPDAFGSPPACIALMGGHRACADMIRAEIDRRALSDTPAALARSAAARL